MKYNAADFYNYFKECYKLDYKEFTIDNILAQKYSFKWFVSTREELITREVPIIPYFNKKAISLEKEIELFKLEKKLFYASFFLLGKNEHPLIKDKRICAPLVLFPAKIITADEDKFLEIENESFIINRSALNKLQTKKESLSKDLFVEELSNLLRQEVQDLIVLKKLFSKYFSNVDTEDLLLFPKVWSAHKIRTHLKESEYEENEYKVIPAAGTILVQKSESSLRVIDDLTAMAEKAAFNSSTEELLGSQTSKNYYDFSYFKSRLNTDQYLALQNSYRFPNSVIVGPPGTGKTYTITSIVTDAVVKNQSILVVSKTKQAVEVLREMLQNDFGLKDYLIHTSGSRYKYSLKKKIERYLSGISSNYSVSLNEVEINQLFDQLNKQESTFKELVERELKLSDLEFKDDLSLLDQWKKLILKGLNFNSSKLFNVFEKMEELLLQLDQQINSYSKRKIQTNINTNSKIYRRDIALFYDALDSNHFTNYKKVLKRVNHRNILKVFPIWLANLSDLNSVLPLQPDLFDLVIIDESTQCDIASALPALYRAKRAVIVGDPNQLRHYSFVSNAKQNSLRNTYKLPSDKVFDYRNRSILDLFISNVSNQDQVTFLREHFRSTPSLIEFSNQQFYDGQLEVLKSTPKHTNHKQIELISLPGVRNEKGINSIEAKAVIQKVVDLMEEYGEEKHPPSIGIISPFSTQVNFINKQLKERFGLKELKKFKILCGTPYNFQGSEREIVLISFSVCDKSHPSAFIHANKPEVLNVAITRAKSYQYIFKSVSNSKMKKDSLLYQYFQFIQNFSHTNRAEITQDSFQKEVIQELHKNNFTEIKSGYPLAGQILDILVTYKGKNYFIDLIGHPGMFKDSFPLERYKTLSRTGVKSFPLHYSFWKKNKTEATKRIIDFIQ